MPPAGLSPPPRWTFGSAAAVASQVAGTVPRGGTATPPQPPARSPGRLRGAGTPGPRGGGVCSRSTASPAAAGRLPWAWTAGGASVHCGCLSKKTLRVFVLVSSCCPLKKEESQRKKLQEINNQKANDRIEALERAKQRLEQETRASRVRLQAEALAARQVTPRRSPRRVREGLAGPRSAPRTRGGSAWGRLRGPAQRGRRGGQTVPLPDVRRGARASPVASRGSGCVVAFRGPHRPGPQDRT